VLLAGGAASSEAVEEVWGSGGAHRLGRTRRRRQGDRHGSVSVREQGREGGADLDLLVYHFERRCELSDHGNVGRTKRRRFLTAATAAATAAGGGPMAHFLVALLVGVVSGVGRLLAALAGVRALGGRRRRRRIMRMTRRLGPEDDLPGEGRQENGARDLLVLQHRLARLVQACSFLRLR